MPESVSPICEHCTNCKFDDIWGEYKCLYLQLRLYEIGEIASCEHKNQPLPKKRRKKS